MTAPPHVIEIDARAEQVIDARMTRRLVALELSDITIPPGTSGDASGLEPVLFYRVIEDQGRLRVELWERGDFYGARTLSGEGESPQLRSRRIALVAGELARRMRHQRQAEARQARAAELERKQKAEAQRRMARALATRVRSGIAFHTVGMGDYWQLGPLLATRLGATPNVSIELGGAWQFGKTGSGASRSSRVEGLKLFVAPQYRYSMGDTTALHLGAALAASTLHFADAHSIDAIQGETQSYTTSASGLVGLEIQAASALSLRLDGEAGWALRSIELSLSDGEDPKRLGGLLLGAQLGVVLRP